MATKLYISVQGDHWDLISLKNYGMKRGDDHHMDVLLEANYALKDVCEFPGGIAVFVPALPVVTEIPIVPWKSASVITPTP